MLVRRLGTALACGGLALVGVTLPAAPAVAAEVFPVVDAQTLIDGFALAETDDVVRLAADIVVAPEDGLVVVPDDVTLTLDLNGHDLEIHAPEDHHPGINVTGTSGLVIDGPGELTVTGGTLGAGIGGGWGQTGGMVTINSATVTSTGGTDGAGIGGGCHGGAGTITINSGNVTARTAEVPPGELDSWGAGIGGACNGGSGIINIHGGTVTATGNGGSAGIGGGGLSGGGNGGVITITGGTVEATAEASSWGARGGGAGIGAANGRSAGPVIISGGIVTATGGSGSEAGPGIGQGGHGEMTVMISGGTVTAVGGLSNNGEGGAGIGGVPGTDGVPTEITGGTVTAIGQGGGAGIGGGSPESPGSPGSGSDLTIGSDAMVTVAASDGGNAIGEGTGGEDFGSLTNAGDLTIESGSTLTVPAGITVDNSGTLTAAGDVVNEGTIVNTGTVVNPENVSVHHYLLQYDVSGGSGPAPAEQRVFAATLDDAQVAPPDDPERDGHTFAGWHPAPEGAITILANGDPLAGDTVLGDGAEGPLTQTWYAHWTALLPPAWAGAGAAEFTVGTSGTATFPVTGADTVDQTSGTLPDGLTAAVTADGVTLSGTPAAGTAGVHQVEFTATGPGGDAVLAVTLTIVAVDSGTPPPGTPEPPGTPGPSGAGSGPAGTSAGTSLPAAGAADVTLPIGIALMLIVGGSAAIFVARRRTP